MTSFADIIAEDFHQTLLEKGNLPREWKPPRLVPEWKETSRAHVTETHLIVDGQACQSCGSINYHIVGLFRVDHHQNGTTIKTRLPFKKETVINLKKQINLTPIPFCLDCL